MRRITTGIATISHHRPKLGIVASMPVLEFPARSSLSAQTAHKAAIGGAGVFNRPLSWATVGLIRSYRRWISPHKGFRCAHHALHGAGSCSTFGLATFQTHPFGHAVSLLRDRFKDCRQAYQVLASQGPNDRPTERDDPNTPPGRLAPRWDACACDALSLVDCGSAIPCDSACDIAACPW